MKLIIIIIVVVMIAYFITDFAVYGWFVNRKTAKILQSQIGTSGRANPYCSDIIYPDNCSFYFVKKTVIQNLFSLSSYYIVFKTETQKQVLRYSKLHYTVKKLHESIECQ